jgi:hypothetical protein
MQPRLPLLPDRDPVAQILIKEHFMTVVDQPSVQQTSQRGIRAGLDHSPGLQGRAPTRLS